MTRVVNLYKEQYDVYIGRKNRFMDPKTLDGKPNQHRQSTEGYFGNPFSLKPKASQSEREDCLALYLGYFEKRIAEDPAFKLRVLELKGKTLGCFCKPKLCHGDVIASYLNNLP